MLEKRLCQTYSKCKIFITRCYLTVNKNKAVSCVTYLRIIGSTRIMHNQGEPDCVLLNALNALNHLFYVDDITLNANKYCQLSIEALQAL